MEFSITWSYFWLTQIKILVFTLAHISQTLTIIYMVYMTSQNEKNLMKIMTYSIIVFVVGLLSVIGSLIYIEESAKKMLDEQKWQRQEKIQSNNPYLCDARDYIVFDEWLRNSPIMIIDQVVLLIQIIIFFIFVKKIKNALDN